MIMELGFMLDERYNFFQQDISDKALTKELATRLPRHMERFCGELLAQAYDGQFNYFYSKEFDIDFVITRNRKVLASGEVKWGEAPTGKDTALLLKRTRHLRGDKILFSKRPIKDGRIISLTPNNFQAWLKKKQ